jgi:tripartite-type tricarboxylate transporter receptor subunit TctC
MNAMKRRLFLRSCLTASAWASPNIVLVPNSSPAKSVRELIDYAKKNPGKLNDASSGNGTIFHLTSEFFKAQSGSYIVHIPYRGTAIAIADLISGKIDLLFDSLVTGLPHAKDGKLRALAVNCAKQRKRVWPNGTRRKCQVEAHHCRSQNRRGVSSPPAQ